MYIEVEYGEKTFGNGSNAHKYDVRISQDTKSNEVSILFGFDPYADGKNDNGNNSTVVGGGELRLPKRQALALASAILWCCNQSEYQKESLPIEIHLDERDINSVSEPAVRANVLANILRVPVNQIVQEAHNLNYKSVTWTSVLPIELASKIMLRLTKEPQESDL